MDILSEKYEVVYTLPLPTQKSILLQVLSPTVLVFTDTKDSYIRELSQWHSFTDIKVENVTLKKCVKGSTQVTCWDGQGIWLIKEGRSSEVVQSGVMAIGSDGQDKVVMMRNIENRTLCLAVYQTTN